MNLHTVLAVVLLCVVNGASDNCEWSSWGNPRCTRYCGSGGVQNYTRSCVCSSGDRLNGLNGVNQGCIGSSFKVSDSCNTRDCCGWSSWGSFSDCSVGCGEGTKQRNRTCYCTHPITGSVEPTNGALCGDPSQSVQQASCQLPPCCQWRYSPFSDCTTSCPHLRTKTATCQCTDDSKYDSIRPMACTGEAPPDIVEECSSSSPSSPSDCCSFFQWSSWTTCSATMGGVKYRRQICSCEGTPNCGSTYDDSKCRGEPLTEVVPCNVTSNCVWDYIEDWSNCDSTCCGSHWRRQKCLCEGIVSADSNCDLVGKAPQVQTRQCGTNCACSASLSSSCPFSSDPCSKEFLVPHCNCPSGDATSNITVPLSYCSYSSDYFRETKSTCYIPPDGSPRDASGTSTCSWWDTASNTCQNYTISYSEGSSYTILDQQPCNSKNCYARWSDWTPCCGSCGTQGTQWRVQLSDSVCPYPPAVETRTCPLTINMDSNGCCRLGDWGPWSKCSPLTGLKWRSRLCSCADESLCPRYVTEVTTCSVSNCRWTPSTSTKCSGNCSVGTGSLWTSDQCSCGDSQSACDISQCTGKPPSYGKEKVTCSVPLECRGCRWTPWSTFSQCTKECGGGVAERTRLCLCNNNNLHNPNNCSGPSLDTHPCNLQECTRPKTSDDWRKMTTWPGLNTGSFSTSTDSTDSFTCNGITRTWREILNTKNPTEWDLLCIQVITAKLNIRHKSHISSLTADALRESLALLKDCNWDSQAKSDAASLTAILENYNNGQDKVVLISVSSKGETFHKASSQGEESTMVIIPGVLLGIGVAIGITTYLVVTRHRRSSPTNEPTNHLTSVANAPDKADAVAVVV